MGFTPSDYAKYMAGKADPRIVEALKDPNSEASRYFARVRAAAQNALTVDWAGVVRRDLAGENQEEVAEAREDSFESGEPGISVASGIAVGEGEQNLRRIREARNLKAEDLASAIHRDRPGTQIDAAWIRAIEDGQRELDVFSATALARPLGVSPAELLPHISTEDHAIVLREPAPPQQERVADESEGASVADLERELGDFLPMSVAKEMIAAWQRGNVTLKKWIESHANEEGDYGILLLRALAAMSLSKDHSIAEPLLEALVQFAGSNPGRQQDALYLRGRVRWYLKKIAEAARDISGAVELTRETKNALRQTQAEYYLARIAMVAPKEVSEAAESILQRTEDRARQMGRPDLELLAKRAYMILYRTRKQRDKAIPLGRELLAPNSRWANLGFSHILDSVRTDLGVSLRGIYTEEARREAEQLYAEGIQRKRDDSHAGMCMYLMADLFIDRMLGEMNRAAEQRGEPKIVLEAIAKAEEYRQKALALCEESQRVLKGRGDSAALEKANRRLVFLQSSDLVSPPTETGVVADYAVRLQHVTELFLGAPRRGAKSPYNPAVNELGRAQLEELLAEYFSGVLVGPGREAHPRQVSLENFLRSDSLLCIPWLVGPVLVVRVFGSFSGSDKIHNIGWFVVRGYVNEVRPSLRDMLSLSNVDFLRLSGSYFREIQRRVETIDPMSRYEHAALQEIKTVVVLAPQSSQEWLCPVEWLSTGPDRGEPGVSILDYASGALVFSASDAGPFESLEASIPEAGWGIVATTQSADKGSIYDFALRVEKGVRQWDLSPASFPRNDSQALIVIAHLDTQQSVEKALQNVALNGVKCVALLFCSSGHYSAESGPFVDGAALRIRERLGRGGLVIGARVPVVLDEALRFASELCHLRNRGRSIAEVVTAYLNAVRFYGNMGPYQAPWIVLG